MWRDIFTIRGRWERLNRLRYFGYTLLGSLIFVLASVVLFAFVNTLMAGSENDSLRSILNFVIYFFVLLVPGIYFPITIGTKRLHDLGYSGWWIIVIFVPLLNIVLGIYLLFWKGEKGKNKYGPDPLEQK